MTRVRHIDGTITDLPSNRVWTCSVCGASGQWSDKHQWYGSYLDIEGGRHGKGAQPIIVTCSDGCREYAAFKNLVPDDAELLS